MILFSNLIFAADFQTHLSVSAGPNITFSKAEHDIWKQYNGFRISNFKINLNALLSAGYNHKIKNDILTSISVLVETGYNFSGYMRPTDGDFGEEGGTVYFHSLVLGLIPTLNFYNDLSLGIGAGIMFPLSANITDYWDMMGDYEGAKKLSFKDIKSFYKVPIMPYIKLNLERHIYFSEKGAFTYGLNIVYNFGMEFNMDRLKNPIHKEFTYDGYGQYKFSSLSFELLAAISFGRPK